jgi:D-alanine-D-alanine ligase
MTPIPTSRKLRIAVLFGGRSGEHEVSLMSARSVLSVLDPQKYDVIQIGITREGHWVSGEDVLHALETNHPDGLQRIFFSPEPGASNLYEYHSIQNRAELHVLPDVDVYFPVLHGTFGEDGTLQGLLELADVAYVGAGVTGSAVGMDKVVFKDVMRAQGIPVIESIISLRSEIESDIEAVIRKAEQLGSYPFFTKPANLGSSVGITKCRTRSDLGEGILEAVRYDRRILIEKGLDRVREIEVSVLGNDYPEASVPGEVLPSREFYSYESKYIDGTSGLDIPAKLSSKVTEMIRAYAVQAFKAIDCAGMARVDFFVEKDTDTFYLNELNSIPGFTQISMYPKLWEASGIAYPELVEKLIDLAIERKRERDRTEHGFRRKA